MYGCAPSTFSTQLKESENECVICEQQGHGIHFGVFACRACAAFFRRTIVRGNKWTCHRDTGNCRIAKTERYLCRLCRFNKCLKLGMTTDNVQWNRDRATSTVLMGSRKKQSAPIDSQKTAEHRGAASLEAVMKFVDATCPSPRPPRSASASSTSSSADSPKISLNISERVRNIFTNWNPVFNFSPDQNAMERGMTSLKHLRRYQSTAPKYLNVFDVYEFGPNFLESFERITEFYQNCLEFYRLDLQEKVQSLLYSIFQLKIFRSSWYLIQRLERLAISLTLFGKETLDRKVIVVSRNLYIDEETPWESKDFEEFNAPRLKEIMQPAADRMWSEVAKPMFELELTDVELVYIMNQIMWHVEGRGVTKETQSVADVFREKISNDLHDYYTKELKMKNYADRMIKLMHLVHGVEDLKYEREMVLQMIDLFSVCKLDFGEAEIFDYHQL